MNLNKELKKGIIISAIGKYSNFFIQFIILAVLSRILSPDEFGIVAIVNVFLLFFTMLIDMGIGPAIIQNKKLATHQINSIFSFTILLSIILCALFALMSKPIALFYNDIKLINVCLAMSLALFTSGLNIVPQSILLKEKRFLEVNTAQVISSIIGGTVGILLAINHFSYYALIINTIVKNIVMLIINYKRSKIKIAPTIRKNDLKAIYTFSRNQFLFNFINYFSRNLDNILIGKFMSMKDLAYYDKAYTLSLYPNQILTNVITPVIQPILSEFEQQKTVIQKTYLSISKLLAFFGMPITVFLVFSAEEVILFLFGNQWIGSVDTFRILAISVWIQMILSSTGAIFQSSNRTDLLLLSGIISTVLNITSISIGVWTGKIELVALALVISFLVNFIQTNYLLMIKVFNSRQIEFYKNLLDPLIISIIILIPLFFIEYFISDMSILVLLIIKAIISLLMFILGMKITGNMNVLFNIIKRR